MPDANRLENFAKYAAIVSALIAAAVGIGQFRRGVSQSVRELEWKQAEMARTIVNGMMNDEGWDAMTMLDWEEGRTYEIAPGTKVRILPSEVAPALEAALQDERAQAHGGAAIHRRPVRPFLVSGESAAGGGPLRPGAKRRRAVSAQLVRREAALRAQEAASRVHRCQLHA